MKLQVDSTFSLSFNPSLFGVKVFGINSGQLQSLASTISLAVAVPQLKAAVAFYGRQPADEEVVKIKCAVQLHYASLDERVNAGAAAYEAALKKNNIVYEQYIYEGVNHAFHNDTSVARYNEAAAKLAWQRSIDFFGKYLK